MSGKQQKYRGGLAYSTDTSLRMGNNEVEGKDNLHPSQQKLKVTLDTKHRAGKTVTIIDNFKGTDDAMETLCKLLKNKCGCGGSVKDGLIVIQGDMLNKVKEILAKEEYGVK
ncbi:MAG: hypothetical protein RL660_913 [Bacteroidota bacterium]|jgi:translation initiation factor 1